MTKPKFESPNLTADNVSKIAALFPGVVTEAKVNFDMFRTFLVMMLLVTKPTNSHGLANAKPSARRGGLFVRCCTLAEKQFNRQVALNEELKRLRSDLEGLVDGIK